MSKDQGFLLNTSFRLSSLVKMDKNKLLPTYWIVKLCDPHHNWKVLDLKVYLLKSFLVCSLSTKLHLMLWNSYFIWLDRHHSFPFIWGMKHSPHLFQICIHLKGITTQRWYWKGRRVHKTQREKDPRKLKPLQQFVDINTNEKRRRVWEYYMRGNNKEIKVSTKICYFRWKVWSCKRYRSLELLFFKDHGTRRERI